LGSDRRPRRTARALLLNDTARRFAETSHLEEVVISAGGFLLRVGYRSDSELSSTSAGCPTPTPTVPGIETFDAGIASRNSRTTTRPHFLSPHGERTSVVTQPRPGCRS
jgi:hypothetical protein